MNIIGTCLIISSFVVMLTEFHLKSEVGYWILIATGIYIFISVFLFMPRQIMSFVRGEGLVDSKLKLNLIRFQVGAIHAITFLCFIAEVFKYEFLAFIYWLLFALIITFAFTIMFLKYLKKE